MDILKSVTAILLAVGQPRKAGVAAARLVSEVKEWACSSGTTSHLSADNRAIRVGGRRL